MIKREIAVVVSNANKNVNVFETIDAIYSAFFRSVFIQWYNREWRPSQEEQLQYIYMTMIKAMTYIYYLLMEPLIGRRLLKN